MLRAPAGAFAGCMHARSIALHMYVCADTHHQLHPTLGAMRGYAGEAAASMEALVLDSSGSVQEAVRLAGAQWAARLFPCGHVPACYVCVLAAGDEKLGVREAGAAGLLPPKPGRLGVCGLCSCLLVSRLAAMRCA